MYYFSTWYIVKLLKHKYVSCIFETLILKLYLLFIWNSNFTIFLSFYLWNLAMLTQDSVCLRHQLPTPQAYLVREGVLTLCAKLRAVCLEADWRLCWNSSEVLQLVHVANQSSHWVFVSWVDFCFIHSYFCRIKEGVLQNAPCLPFPSASTEIPRHWKCASGTQRELCPVFVFY